MSVAGMVTPCRTETFQNLQLNAGAFLVDFDYSTYPDATSLRTALATALQNDEYVLGATRGGGSFVVTADTREPDVDGKRYSFRGGRFVDSVDAYLTGTLVEIRPSMLAKVMATGDVSNSGQKTTLTMHTAIKDEDYIDSLIWVGDMSDGGLILIDLKNALNTNGVTLTFTDKGEGTIPFEFHAHQDAVEDYDNAPFAVHFLDAVATPGISIYPKTNELKVGSTLTLTKTVSPDSATVTYSSDATAKATVTSGGVVSGVAVGTATITASITVGGSTYSDSVFVRVVSA